MLSFCYPALDMNEFSINTHTTVHIPNGFGAKLGAGSVKHSLCDRTEKIMSKKSLKFPLV